ncbi:uncharacterized protein LOC127905090 [Populus trichocarpa]|uniref:uncharacterized protein LOC127905090 n=1 Tax=Populus trichocarpa TaxID=3694 RepID=UPI002278F7A8|nr:uncharacterized protein LOC127905090 [Populus trichocarpa]
MDRFLPVDYEQHLYRLYHNCTQGSRTIKDYTDEFLRLVERNSLNETQGQTVSRYVNGLTTSIQDRIGLQVFWDIHEAQNMAMKAQQLEKELKEREQNEKKMNYGNNNNYPRKTADSYVPNKEKKEVQPIQRNNYKGQNYRGESSQNNDINQNRNQRPNHGPYARATGDVCYRCFQPGHRSNNCPKRKQANLVEGTEEADDHSGNYDDDYDGAEFAYEDNNEVVNLMMNRTAIEEDEVLSMVLQRALLSPKQEGQRNHIFRSLCSVDNKVCTLIVDGGSCENFVSKKLVDYLKLPTEMHKNPYMLGWVNHVLLGRPWQFDVDATHKGRDNVFIFEWVSHKIALAPVDQSRKLEKPQVGSSNFLAISKNSHEFEDIIKEVGCMYPIVLKGLMVTNAVSSHVPKVVQEILSEYEDLVFEDLPAQLPPMRDIQHQIDLVPGASLPNLPHYRMSPKENVILKEKIEELLEKRIYS